MICNFHTHTARCHHAEGTDREYVESAVAQGFDKLGFSDHSPWPYRDFVSRIRMAESEVDEYHSSISDLKAEFKDRIDILIGLECEYFPDFFPWLDELKERLGLDYLILGNHFLGDEITGLYSGKATTKDQLKLYVREVEKAMGSGRFVYLAHPDIIFSSYPWFDDTARGVAEDICALSKELCFPLEYNLQGKRKALTGLGYPTTGFWEIAAFQGCSAIMGSDAHDPASLNAAELVDSQKLLAASGLNIIDTI